MEITDEMIQKLEHLSRLDLSDEARASMKNDLVKMIDFVNKLKELDTEGVEPLIYMNEHELNMRDDVEHTDITHDEALQNAPDADTDYIKVPKVLRKS